MNPALKNDSPAPLVQLQDIDVGFGHIRALEGACLELHAGEVVALLGDNGAGKSTLIKVLTGLVRPQAGDIRVNGESLTLASPSQARKQGIEAVYQDLALVPLMSIARNFFLGRELTRSVGPVRLLDEEEMDRQASRALVQIGIQVRDTSEPVEGLSGGERQSIAIGRAVHFGSKVLILDEPTSALSIGETEKVLQYVEAARARGLGVILITHNLDHVYKVSDRLVILSQGKTIANLPVEQIEHEEAARLIMSGAGRKTPSERE
ncbi:MAG: ABC transporter ATP-binding protein [Gemmatimonadetes bacterium]|nr:ABC transporter ATP-binding protein [Gemmatimonadota bacterium]